ncbi:MAG: methylenetetrahydrofolate reductase [NAD(P)H] [Oscillospiraceae bacterium]|mgnify:CR=1 FL=1|nr:methylenetetrahydrofolate reductase [NAD(P)H] [Oscillospiraceae bacterium]MDD3833319.1 methylenetetrahydrofolate reductase [NAD(P)H] [Oscillospiraceae bacterium]
MSIAELYSKKQTVYSFEIFPPKKDGSIDTIYNTLNQLEGLNPDYISVTYGAGGNPADKTTSNISSIVKEKFKILPLAHLTCVNNSREDILEVLDQFKEQGIKNILALRGDFRPDIPPKTDFRYANELVDFIKNQGGFHISGACYPHGHPESESMIDDIHNLRKKVDAGAEHLISQLFFDNSAFYSFVERARIAGINVPIDAGIMPVTSKKQIERMVSLTAASLPAKFTKIISRYEHNPEALRDAGIAYAVDQMVDLISNGVQGIHLYTMNNPLVAQRITQAISSLINA